MTDCLHPFWIPADCQYCNGSGEIEPDNNASIGKCPVCKGTGRKEGYEECNTCHRVTIKTFETEGIK